MSKRKAKPVEPEPKRTPLMFTSVEGLEDAVGFIVAMVIREFFPFDQCVCSDEVRSIVNHFSRGNKGRDAQMERAAIDIAVQRWNDRVEAEGQAA
jgi:hypothetical protein